MCYYQAGIGTYTTPEIATPMMAKLSKTLDMMVAWNLDAHVMDGYVFLMQNYSAGDKICIFGFSRGAYTARALAGMVHKVGLLPACNHQQVPFAYKMYSRTDETGWKQSTAFKKAFSMDVDIEFLGVWDTVSSVGLIPRRLPFTTSNTAIKTFRHALALDEHRAKFRPNTFVNPTKTDQAVGVKAGEMPKAGAGVDVAAPNGADAGQDAKDAKANGAGVSSARPKRRHSYLAHEAAFDAEEAAEAAEAAGVTQKVGEPDVLEVWFAGCHCDVGGGSVPNGTLHTLARIPLRWMIRHTFLSNTGIRFHARMLAGIGLDPDALYPTVKARPAAVYYTPAAPQTSGAGAGNPPSPSSIRKSDTAKTLVNYAEPSSPSTGGAEEPTVSIGYTTVPAHLIGAMDEEQADLADALCPIYDQLSEAPWWWALEVIPWKYRAQREGDEEWLTGYRINFGRPRHIPRQHISLKVHRSVKVRMEAGRLGAVAVPGPKGEGEAGKKGAYNPRAKLEVEPEWVD
ncbi:hypothetical protein JB92DRAFT_2961559 [Gautieria morchelliformis]|nr:hypothetical protein JB92DRAFT_2961559 [Gautieria morchelliformis]